MISYLESSLFILTHGLNLANQLTDKAFLNEFRSKLRIHNYRHIVIPLGYKTLCLRHRDK